MEQKDLIIGGVQNYGIAQLKPWVLSVIEHMPDAHRVLCVSNISDETRQWLIDNQFELVELPKLQIPVHVLRFVSIYDYLRKNTEKYRYVVTTDVKDVYFQKNPFEYMEKNKIGQGPFKIVASSESIRYKDESWGNENLLQTYGPYIHELFKNNEIYNVGVLGGTVEYIRDLTFNIFSNAINRPISIVDQAVFNVLIQTYPYKDCILFNNQLSGWAVQLGTTADSNKISQFRPFLTEKEPIFDYETNLVKTAENQVFYIVHQYDRVSKWKEIIEKKYS